MEINENKQIRILWLYRYIKEYNFDHWLHMSFVQAVKNYKDAYFIAYGPGLREPYKGVTPLEYNPVYTLQMLHDAFKFDVVVVNTKSRCFFHYNPKTKEEQGMWLPPDFARWKKTPKIVIEEDYHYETDDDWYRQMNIDLILQRHYSQSLRQQHVPMKWLPFSVDTASFNTSRQYTRIPKLAFVGNSADDAYLYRKTATNKLLDVDLCANFAGSKKVDGDYVDVLQRYLGYISCGSIYEICAAKNLEIMASGGVLFTNRFKGIELLFDENCYCSYNNDGSDVVAQGRKLLFDVAYRESVVEAARECIFEKHTHEVRMDELLKLLGEMK
jgi:hypothetical protein